MGKAPKWMAWVVLIVGILWLLVDLGISLPWWTLNWWTALFVLAGLGMLLKK